MINLPTGTVTFLFTDIEGSSQLWQAHPNEMEHVLARHDALLRATIEEHAGHVVKMRGDGVHAVFASAADGVNAALSALRALVNEAWPQPIERIQVRMGLHTGQAQLRDGDYFGPIVNQAARIQDIGHGGQILLSEATQAVVRDVLPDQIKLVDLGEHHIRDFPRPERVFQLTGPELEATFPPLRSLSQRRSNLPEQPTPIIGRESELTDVANLLEDPQKRLVTIVGPGGIGKTRLSLAVADRQLETGDFPDGIYIVFLAPLESAGNIVSAIAEAIDYRFFGEREPWRQLVDYLAGKRMLLVLDNFEHLLADGAGHIASLLRQVPEVKVLIASRERLHLSGEAVYRIAGLAYPGASMEELTADKATGYGSVQLLLHHARLLRPSIELPEAELLEASRICQLVQGMPLAIVLAAGWLETLSFKEIGDEIASNLDILESENRDMPARQRSVRAAFAYSWQRLSQSEKEAFMKLSVFRGGFTRQAAAQIAGAGLRVLRSLVEKSLLVSARPGRYDVHELLRQFVAEKLIESGVEEETRGGHSAYYLQAASDREVELKGRRLVQALDEIEGDLENVRAAWKWALQQQEEDLIANALESLYLYFEARGRYQEGVELLHGAREALAEGSASRLLARIIARECWLHTFYFKDRARLETDLARSLSVAQQHDDSLEAAFANLALGHYYSRLEGGCETALPSFEACRAQFQASDEKFYLAVALVRLGYCMSTFAKGEDSFLEYTRQGLALARQIGNMMQIASSSSNLGSGLISRGDYREAAAHLDEAIAVASEMGHRLTLAHASTNLGLLNFLLGDPAESKALAIEGLAMATELGFRITQAYALAVLSLAAVLNGDYARALQLGQDSLARPSNPNGQCLGHWALSMANCGLERDETARLHLSRALRVSADFRWLGTLTWLMPVASLLEYRAGRHSNALSLLSLAMTHPSSATGWVEEWVMVAEMRTDLSRKLGTQAFQMAWEQGSDFDLEKVAMDLLAEYGE